MTILKPTEKVVVIFIAAAVQLVVLIGLLKLYSVVMGSYADGSPSRLPFLTKLVIETSAAHKIAMCLPLVVGVMVYLCFKAKDRHHFVRNCATVTATYVTLFIAVILIAIAPHFWMWLTMKDVVYP